MFSKSLVSLCTLCAIFHSLDAMLTASINKGIIKSRAPQDASRFSLQAVTRSSHPAHDLEKRNSGSVAALSVDKRHLVHYSRRWYPPQEFLLLPDAGAPDFTLFSVNIPSKHHSNTVPLYNPRKSTTAKQVDGYSWNETYIGGENYSGPVYTDVVSVGKLTISNFQFEVCDQTTVSQIGGIASGTLGLSHTKTMPTSPKRISSWFPTVMSQLLDPVFTVDYNSATSSGTFDFGYVDEEKFTGSIIWLPNVPSAQYWEVSMSGIAVGSTFYEFPSSMSIDTGDPGSSLPVKLLDLYFKAVKGAVWTQDTNTYVFDCDAQLPDLVFGMGDQRYGISGKKLQASMSEHGKCRFLVTGEKNVIWGQRLIENTFMIFDMGLSRMGFAAKP